MLDKLFANKKLFVLIVAAVVLILGMAVVVSLKHSSKDLDDSGVNIEEEDENDENDDSSKKDDVYDGNGLEIKDETDGSVDSVDFSGDWDEPSDNNDKKEQSDKTDKTNKEDAGNPKDEDDKKDENDNSGEESDEDILIDDKTWGEPS